MPDGAKRLTPVVRLKVYHEWGRTTCVTRGKAQAIQRVELNAGGFSGLVRRRLASVSVFCESGNVVVETSKDKGANVTATWINPAEFVTVPPGDWLRLVAPERPACVLLIVSGIVAGIDFEMNEPGGVLPLGGTRRTTKAA